MANIPIGNNIIYMQRKGSSEIKDTTEAVLLGAERVDVGVPSGRREIAKDKYSGLNYEREAIDSKTIYSLKDQKRKCFFILDLETGRGNGSWYPGSIRICFIKNNNTALKDDKSESATTILLLNEGTQVKILDIEYDNLGEIWYKINYENAIGYLKNIDIKDIKYVDPY